MHATNSRFSCLDFTSLIAIITVTLVVKFQPKCYEELSFESLVVFPSLIETEPLDSKSYFNLNLIF